MTNETTKRRLDEKTKPRWEALFSHVCESQEFCESQGEMMNPQELRKHIAAVNRQFCFDLDKHWQEIAAKCVEVAVGVRIN